MYFIALGVAVHSLSVNVLENGVGGAELTDVVALADVVAMAVELADAVVAADAPAGRVGVAACLDVCATCEDWPGSK
jgi:hypothetical protein